MTNYAAGAKTPSQPALDLLFQPFTTGSLTLKNRIVMPAMGRHFVTDGVPSRDYAEYFRRRAQGGVGLAMTEVVAVDHATGQKRRDYATMDGDVQRERWTEIVEAVHSVDGKIFPQLFHAGMTRVRSLVANPDVESAGPSGLHSELDGVTRPMVQESSPLTMDEIKEIVAAFGRSAATAKSVGFDGIEIHGAHGYLIDQFFWSKTNRRDDIYGGSLENRGRFAAEIVAECRKQVGPDFPICFRFSQWKQQDYSAKLAFTPGELKDFLMPLVHAGVDIFHCSQRRIWEPEFEGDPRNLAGWTREITGKPTITVGSVSLDNDPFLDRPIFAEEADTTPEMPPSNELSRSVRYAVDMLAAGECDFVAIGRAVIADPEWPNKVKAGAWRDLRPYSRQLLTSLE